MQMDEARYILSNLRDRFETAGDGHRRLAGVLTTREVDAFDVAIALVHAQFEPAPALEAEQLKSQVLPTVRPMLADITDIEPGGGAADSLPVTAKTPGAPRDPDSALSKARHIYARMVESSARREIVRAVVAATGVSMPVASTYIHSIDRANGFAMRKRPDVAPAS